MPAHAPVYRLHGQEVACVRQCWIPPPPPCHRAAAGAGTAAPHPRSTPRTNAATGQCTHRRDCAASTHAECSAAGTARGGRPAPATPRGARWRHAPHVRRPGKMHIAVRRRDRAPHSLLLHGCSQPGVRPVRRAGVRTCAAEACCKRPIRGVVTCDHAGEGCGKGSMMAHLHSQCSAKYTGDCKGKGGTRPRHGATTIKATITMPCGEGLRVVKCCDWTTDCPLRLVLCDAAAPQQQLLRSRTAAAGVFRCRALCPSVCTK